ncbi:uncharacterized protein LOC125949339 [Anopheles darlingi]|uniref:uncharacterized protein LOC125949339 n=1 Tax=Anopheles darlingi TaxID=43151 RepID=UPI0020FFF8B1|nr:uncharacterized protein LOC125949339 [Anopheles darlingi]
MEDDEEMKRIAIQTTFSAYAAKQVELAKQYETNRKKRCKIFLQRLRYQLKRNGEQHQKEWSEILQEQLLDSVPTRKFWKLNRSDQWYRNLFEGEEDNADQLFENFRLDRPTYDMLVEALNPDMAPHPLLISQSCSTEKKVAVALYKLISGSDYASVGDQFGVHKATVKNCLFQFCKALVKNFMDAEIALPLTDEAMEISSAFEEKCDLPMVMGALGLLHIPITPSGAESKNYLNSKKWASITLQAVVDHNHLFRHITCGHTGCTEESAVLTDSGLYQHFENAEMPAQMINGNPVQGYIVTEPTYPLLPWLIHDYTPLNNPITTEEQTFNDHLAKAKAAVHQAFTRLRARFGILQRKIDIDINFVPQILLTCCILHNILEKRKMKFEDEWIEQMTAADQKYPQPDGSIVTNYTTSVEGETVRDQLKDHVQSKYMLFRSIDYSQVYFINDPNH